MMQQDHKPDWPPVARRFRASIVVFVGTIGILAIPVVQGYREGPVFPVLDPSPWEALKAAGRHMAFQP